MSYNPLSDTPLRLLGISPRSASTALTLAALISLGVALPEKAWADDPVGSATQGQSMSPTAMAKEIEELKRQVQELVAAQQAAEASRLEEIERRLEILASEVERINLGKAAAVADDSEFGFGPAASKVYRTEQGLSIGGYGEMLYESVDSERDDGDASGKTDQLDFLRAIVYFGYKFNDKWVFNSEIEFEHASTSKSGEASVEFAYLDYLHKPALNFRAGMVLMPMGFVNELHEPTVFLGARRPDIERVIIPSTWRENGVGVFGDAGPISYRAYVVNGFDATGFGAGGLRGGRQKGSKAKAEDLAWVGRVDVTPHPGLTFGAAAYFGDSGQGVSDGFGQTLGVGTTIYEGHLEWRWRGLQVRALAARAEVDDVAALNASLGLSGSGSVGEELAGEYFELAYDVLSTRSGQSNWQIMPYLRWESFDTQHKVPTGFSRNPANDVESWTLGVAFKPMDQLILKVDFLDRDNGARTGVDQVNVALGYIF